MNCVIVDVLLALVPVVIIVVVVVVVVVLVDVIVVFQRFSFLLPYCRAWPSTRTPWFERCSLVCEHKDTLSVDWCYEIDLIIEQVLNFYFFSLSLCLSSLMYESSGFLFFKFVPFRLTLSAIILRAMWGKRSLSIIILKERQRHDIPRHALWKWNLMGIISHWFSKFSRDSRPSEDVQLSRFPQKKTRVNFCACSE